MNIIFLDIDGVITPYSMPEGDRVQSVSGRASRKCVAVLNKIVEATDAEIVVSSAWRTDPRISMALKQLGVVKPILSVTPHDNHKGMLRGNEIRLWLMDNESITGVKHYNFRTYVILDDDSDMLYWQKDNFMKIDGRVGLQETDISKAVSIIRQENF